MANGFHHTTSSGTESIIQQTCTLLLAGWCAEEFGAFYFIFLTNWNLILQTFTTICLFLCAIWGYTAARRTRHTGSHTGSRACNARLKRTERTDTEVSPESSGKAPCFVKFTTALWYIMQPLSMRLGSSFEKRDPDKL